MEDSKTIPNNNDDDNNDLNQIIYTYRLLQYFVWINMMFCSHFNQKNYTEQNKTSS